jgi:putative heme-binding domain-containing protein
MRLRNSIPYQKDNMKQQRARIMKLLRYTFTTLALGFSLVTAAARPEKKPIVVFISGEFEYKSRETLPAFKKFLETNYPLDCRYLERNPGTNVNDIPGLEVLEQANVAVIFIRRMTLPDEQLNRFKSFLRPGKAVVGIRTASHAFENWKEWDSHVLGGNYHGHYGNELPLIHTVRGQAEHPILEGLPTEFGANGGLYSNAPLPYSSTLLLTGAVPGHPSEPVAWTHSYNGARVFYTSLGHPEDFGTEPFKQLIVNAIYWGLNQKVPILWPRLTTGTKLLSTEPPSHFTPEVEHYLKTFKIGGALTDASKPLTPAETLKHFKIADGLQMEVVSAEPVIRQPLNINFDERGRLWVVQYLQFPFPAGLKIVKYDEHMRAVFDKVPPPPPNHFKGADRITILESTRGDGVFDQAKDFVSNLNIARSVISGRGGVWVLNPPYLLFYPDKNRDDIPDGPPEVALSGFGLEDTHSGANSLAWGPDGWLYGAHGSTCTADIKGVKFLGQAIWRYHPVTKQFEVFAEGGGNTYSLEFDAHGLAYSGSNSGETRGLYYVQGGVYTKDLGKHGPLINPYSFGWFKHMPHKGFMDRFPQTIIIYEGGAIPEYEGQLIAGMSLVNRVQASKMLHDTSSWRTEDTEPLVRTDDRWFRPVDTKTGPDGAIYMADWYDSRLSHRDPRDTWDKERGRIYRLSALGAKPIAPFDLAKLNNEELIKYLSQPNKWFRQTALRIFYDRHDANALPALREIVQNQTGQLVLEAFWAVNASGGFNDPFALKTLGHANPFVRYWTVRLLGDTKTVSPLLRSKLVELAHAETDAQVRSQLASTCKRLPGKDAIPIIRELLFHTEDENDTHIPMLLWWAIESKCGQDRELVLDLFRDVSLWRAPIVSNPRRSPLHNSNELAPETATILSRLGQRYTAERSDLNLITAAELIGMAPGGSEVDELVRGMEAGLQGDAVKSVPIAMQKRVVELWASRPKTPALVSFAARLGHPAAEHAALGILTDTKMPEAERKKMVALLAERRTPAAVPVFLDLLRHEKTESFRLDVLNNLQRFADDRIAQTVLELYPVMSAPMRDLARSILCSRVIWSRMLLQTVANGAIAREQLPVANLLAIQNHHDATCDELIRKQWGSLKKSSAEKEQQIAAVRKVLSGGKGDPHAGRELFKQSCAACHTLFGEGAQIGPELTGDERDNLDFLLPAIVDPSLGIREEYTTFTLTTKDDQSLTGFLVVDQPKAVTMMDTTGHKLVIAREQIQSLRASPVSLMPEGLLDTLNEQQIRDLISYVVQKK